METKRVNSSPATGVDPLSTGRAARPDAVKKPGSDVTSGTGVAPSETFDVNVSQRARELSESRKKALDIAKSTPDIREERVAELRKKIQSGTYKVDASKVADGMVNEAIKDEVALMMHDEAKQR